MSEALRTHIKNYIDVSDEDMKIFTSLLVELEFDSKSFLLTPNTQIQYNFFIVKGCLKAYYMDDMGDKHVIQFAIENWWISDYDAFYHNLKPKLHIEAIENSTVLAITNENLEVLFQKAKTFERYFRILNTNAFIAQQKRILSSLEKNTTSRYLEFCASFPNIENRVQNYHIANYLGVSAESLSRIRRNLKR